MKWEESQSERGFVSNYVKDIETGISPFKKQRKRKSTRLTIEYHVKIPKVSLSLLRDDRGTLSERRGISSTFLGMKKSMNKKQPSLHSQKRENL